jgi:hypothetical protein
MSRRTSDFLLTVLGTLLVIGTFVSVLVIPIYVAFGMISAKPGDGAGLRVTIGTLGFLGVASACAAGAWAIRRILTRIAGEGRRPRRTGFDVAPPPK